jgi:hypothetical protein
LHYRTYPTADISRAIAHIAHVIRDYAGRLKASAPQNPALAQVAGSAGSRPPKSNLIIKVACTGGGAVKYATQLRDAVRNALPANDPAGVRAQVTNLDEMVCLASGMSLKE